MKTILITVILISSMTFVACIIILPPYKEETKVYDWYAIDDNRIDITGDQNLYLFDTINGEYHYIVQLSEGNCIMDVDVSKSRCCCNAILLHFKGQYIDHLNGEYEIIPDSLSYVKISKNYTYQDTNTVYLTKGVLTLHPKNDNGYQITFSGLTKKGQSLTVDAVAYNNVSYYISREVCGHINYKNKDYDISIFNLRRGYPNLEYGLTFSDYDRKDSLKLKLHFFIYSNDSILNGKYNLTDSLSIYNSARFWINHNNGQEEVFDFNKGTILINDQSDTDNVEIQLISQEFDTLHCYWSGQIKYLSTYNGM